MASIRVRVGSARDLPPDTTDRVQARVVREIAEEVVRRVQDRTDRHPAAMTLRARGVNQWVAEVVGTRGGPGIIRPVRRKALWWAGARHPVASVQGVGFEPLMKAEAERIQILNINAFIP